MWSFITSPVQTIHRHYAKKNIQAMDWDMSMKITGLKRKETELCKTMSLINSVANKNQSLAYKRTRSQAIWKEIQKVRREIAALQNSKASLESVIGAFDQVDIQKSMVNCMGVLNTEMTNNKELGSVMSQFRGNILNMGLSLETMDKELQAAATQDIAHQHQEDKTMTTEEQKQMMEEFGLNYADQSENKVVVVASIPVPTERIEEQKEIDKEKRPETPDSDTRTLQQRLEKLQVIPIPPHVKQYA